MSAEGDENGLRAWKPAEMRAELAQAAMAQKRQQHGEKVVGGSRRGKENWRREIVVYTEE